MIDNRSPVRFFLLVFALSIPFALLGAMTGVQLAAGIPIAALGFLCPVTAASILVYRDGGVSAVAQLLRRACDWRRTHDKAWYIPVVFLMPVMGLATHWLMRSTGLPIGAQGPPLTATAVMAIAFLLSALGEELGWSGYAIDPMQQRWSALVASLVLGAVWASWHIVAMIQAGQSAAWIGWGCLDMVGTRVLMVWLYNNTGKSVFAVALYHAIANISTKTLFPGGSYEAEQILSLIIVAVAAVVAMVWRPRTLAEPLWEHSGRSSSSA